MLVNPGRLANQRKLVRKHRIDPNGGERIVCSWGLLDQSDAVDDEVRPDGGQGSRHLIEYQSVDVPANALLRELRSFGKGVVIATNRDPGIARVLERQPQAVAQHARPPKNQNPHGWLPP